MLAPSNSPCQMQTEFHPGPTKHAMPKKMTSINVPLLLMIPESVGLRLLADSVSRSVTVQSVILEIVGRHYGVDVSHPKRGRPIKSVKIDPD